MCNAIVFHRCPFVSLSHRYIQKDKGQAHYRFLMHPVEPPERLQRMCESYVKHSVNTMAANKISLTPRNIMNEVFKFYREHLYPIQPVPSFERTLQWA